MIIINMGMVLAGLTLQLILCKMVIYRGVCC